MIMKAIAPHHRMSMRLSSSKYAQSRFQTTVAASAPDTSTSADQEGPAFGFTPADLENAQPYSAIPSPPSFPFFGNLFSFKPFTKVNAFDRVQSNSILEDRFGPIYRLNFPFIPQFSNWVEILDPLDFEIVFRNEGKFPERPGDPAFTRYREKRRHSLGLINTNQEDWWNLRQPLNKTMMRSNAALPYLETQSPIADELVDVVRRNVRQHDGQFPMIMASLQRWALESVAAVVFDRKLGCLDESLPADSWQRKFIDSVTSCFTDSVSLGVNPIHKIYNKLGMETKLEKRFDANMDYVTSKSVELVEECRRRYEADPELDLSKRFLPQLLSLDLTVDQKLSVIFDMMAAAIDTTTYAMTFNAYLLAKNPRVQDELYREIVAHCGEDSSSEALTPSILSRMRYLKAVIKETHRLKPIITLNVRAPVRDIVVKGYRIPKGTYCFIEHEYASKSEKNFADPLTFLPERWLREKQQGAQGDAAAMERGNPFVILPFGFGPRMCIGRRFAEQEIYLGLIKLVQAFRFEYDSELPLKGIGLDKLPVKLDFRITER